MATYSYSEYTGDTTISPSSSYDAPTITTTSSCGYESPGPADKTWTQPKSPVSTIDNYNAASALTPSSGATKSAKQLRKEAVERHRKKKASFKALGMMEVRHSGVTHSQTQHLTAKQLRERKIEQHKDLKAAKKALPKMATSSRTRKEKRQAKALRNQFELEQEEAAEQQALKIMTVYETTEGFQVI